jgi:phage tail tape-measure protein
MSVRKDIIRPTPSVDANEMRDANDPIYPDTVQTPDGRVHIANLNPDAITGEPGSHPVGSGLGAAAGGALAGIGLGAVAGPVGAAVGAVIGGVAGGLAGKSVAEAIDPTVEDAYWRNEYPRREYYDEEVSYEAIRPAYRYGWESKARYQEHTWEQAQEELRRDWESSKEDHMAGSWEDAQRPIRDAWDRVEARLADQKTRRR